jgi:glucose-6-phosphate 1-dehydrogenase
MLSRVFGAERLGGELALFADQHLDARFGGFQLLAAGIAEAMPRSNSSSERSSGGRRLHDLASARELSDRLHEVFDESEVYRIDHYLGKETVQNILAFRFGNGIFEPLWNRRYVNHVQITGAESIGVEGRGAYYQEAGALDDMIQNHLLQVMATIAMEPSASFRRHQRARRAVQAAALDSPDDPDEVRQNAVAGQYGPARIGGEDVPGFRQEEGVDPQLADRHLRRGDALRG